MTKMTLNADINQRYYHILELTYYQESHAMERINDLIGQSVFESFKFSAETIMEHTKPLFTAI